MTEKLFKRPYKQPSLPYCTNLDIWNLLKNRFPQRAKEKCISLMRELVARKGFLGINVGLKQKRLCWHCSRCGRFLLEDLGGIQPWTCPNPSCPGNSILGKKPFKRVLPGDDPTVVEVADTVLQWFPEDFYLKVLSLWYVHSQG